MSSKDAYYFSHDANARNDEKIISLRMKLGWEGYGIYWALIEMLRESNGYELEMDYNRIAFALTSDSETIKDVVTSYDLFDFKGTTFFSTSLKSRMEFKDLKSKKARDSANARWNKSERNANALDSQCIGNAKERKGKGNKEKEIEQRKMEFKKLTKNKWIELGQDKYISNDEITKFFEYWTEHGDNDRLMKFEKQDSFGVGRRLGTWKSNNFKPTKPNPNVRPNA